MKRNTWLAILLLLAVGLLVLSGCGGQQEEATESSEKAGEEVKEAEEPAKLDYPTKPITLVYHSKAGSGGDIFLRNLGKALEKSFGQPIVIENRVGAGGANAWTYVSRAKPDGYTLLGISSTILASPLRVEMPVSYKDFDPIAQVFYDPTVIFVRTDSQYDSLADVVEDAKSRPGQQKWGGGNAGSAESLCALRFAEIAGMEIKLVPFEGGGDVIVALVAGDLDVAIGEYAEIKGQVEAGKVKLLTGLGSERIPTLPDLPTLKEEGYDFVFEKIRGLMVPKGTPDEIIEFWNEAIRKVYDDPAFKKYYESSNIIPLYRGPDEMTKAMDEQHQFFKEMLEKMGL